MSTKPVINKSTKLVSPSISSLLGVVQVMPCESEEVYRVGLLATIEELGAQTPLQVYLAEKIFECLWWMRRYETQKRAALIHEMARLLDPTPRPGGQMLAWVITAMVGQPRRLGPCEGPRAGQPFYGVTSRAGLLQQA